MKPRFPWILVLTVLLGVGVAPTVRADCVDDCFNRSYDCICNDCGAAHTACPWNTPCTNGSPIWPECRNCALDCREEFKQCIQDCNGVPPPPLMVGGDPRASSSGGLCQAPPAGQTRNSATDAGATDTLPLVEGPSPR